MPHFAWSWTYDSREIVGRITASAPPRHARPLLQFVDNRIIHEILVGVAARSPSGGSDSNADEPAWFEAFLADRGTRKPSAHTMKAYRQDFEAIAAAIVGDGHPVAHMRRGYVSTPRGS
jgi:hypothetical protein